MKKKIMAMLISCMCFISTACGDTSTGSVTKENSTTNQAESNNSLETTTEMVTSKTENAGLPFINSNEIDVFSKTTDSRYMSTVLHNPEYIPTNKGDSIPLVVVTDMGESLKEAFNTPFVTSFDINDYSYQYTSELGNYLVNCAYVTPVIDSSLIWIQKYEECTNDNGENFLKVLDVDDRIVSYNFRLNDKEKNYGEEGLIYNYIYDEELKWYSEYFVGNSKLEPDTHLEDVCIHIYDELYEGYDCFIRCPLANKVAIDDNAKNTLSNNFETNIIGSVVILDTLSDFDSINKVYGEELPANLEETVFFQDVIAHKLSNLVGLNVKNKNAFKCVDSGEINYVSGKLETEVLLSFSYNVKDYSLDDFKDFKDVSKFAYTDSEGNSWNYFNAKAGVFIFKNGEFTHTVCEITQGKSQDLKWYEAISLMFGTRE